jgi:PTH1 family peptidyl-tRNA hydrolase
LSQPIQLIVGLGNPGEKYAKTRHNAGAWLVQQLAEQVGATLRLESKLHGFVALTDYYATPCRLFIPSTYMNDSGKAVAAIANFYKIPPEAILVAHDELDFAAGIIKLKKGGGHGGHNGLRDLMAHLANADFWRLRIGIGHPGSKDKVHDYVLNQPSRADEELIKVANNQALDTLPLLLKGQFELALTQLHS